MREQNEHIFKLLQKDLESKGEDYFYSVQDVLNFYKKKGSDIGERKARDLIKELYPNIPTKQKKKYFLARQVIIKYILSNLQGDRLEDLLEPYHIEQIVDQLKRNNIDLTEEIITDLLKQEHPNIAVRWISGENAQKLASIEEKMTQSLSTFRELKELIPHHKKGMPDSKIKDYFQEYQFKKDLALSEIEGFSKLARSLGYTAYGKALNVRKAEMDFERFKVSASDEDRAYLSVQLDKMRIESNTWAWAMRDFTGRYFAVRSGRGAGKTYEIAKFFIEKALTEPNTLFVCVRKARNTLKDSSLSALKRIVTDYGLERFFAVNVNQLTCSLTNSSFIFKGTMNPESQLKGLENIKYVWVDECQNIEAEFWKILVPTIRRDDSQIYLSMNPLTEKDPVHVCFIEEKSRRPQTEVVNLTIDDNKYASDKLREDQQHDYETMPADDYEHIWEGQFLKYTEAQIFAGKLEITLTETPPPNTQFYFGLDWGDKDPTAGVRCWVDKDWNLVIDKCFKLIGAELIEFEEALLKLIDNNMDEPIRADTNFPTNNREMKKRGFNIVGAYKPAGSIKDGIIRLKRFNKILIHSENCKPVVADFQAYRYKRDKRTGEIGTVPEDANNHFPDATRYALSTFSGEHPSQLRKSKVISRDLGKFFDP